MEKFKQIIIGILFIFFVVGIFNSCNHDKTTKQSDMPEAKRKAGMTEQQWEEDKKYKQELIKAAEKIEKRGY